MHPETEPGEVFITNCSYTNDDSYEQMEWKTKRVGLIAYDSDGRPVRGLYPVFVKLEEVRNENSYLADKLIKEDMMTSYDATKYNV